MSGCVQEPDEHTGAEVQPRPSSAQSVSTAHVPQVPAMHAGAAALHIAVHVPQCAGSLRNEASHPGAVSQSSKPGRQMQSEDAQSAFVPHAVPHAPHASGSVEVSRQAPAQHRRPAAPHEAPSVAVA